MGEVLGRADEMVQAYLAAVRQELAGVSPGHRDELLDDLRVHIEAARHELPVESEAEIRQILDRLGPPEAVAAAARAEELPGAGTVRGLDPGPGNPPSGSGRGRRRALVIALVVMAALVLLSFLLLVVGALFAVSNSSFDGPYEQEGGSTSVGPVQTP